MLAPANRFFKIVRSDRQLEVSSYGAPAYARMSCTSGSLAGRAAAIPCERQPGRIMPVRSRFKHHRGQRSLLARREGEIAALPIVGRTASTVLADGEHVTAACRAGGARHRLQLQKASSDRRRNAAFDETGGSARLRRYRV